MKFFNWEYKLIPEFSHYMFKFVVFFTLDIFTQIYYYQIRIENKVGKKLPRLFTQCVTGVTRFLITLFRFINWSNRNINGEIELANL